MLRKITDRAQSVAAAHGIWSRVHCGEDQEATDPAKLWVVRVEFFQDVFTRPIGGPEPSDIQNRRFINIPRGDAKRLRKQRKGLAGGEPYVLVRGARGFIHEVGPDEDTALARAHAVVISNEAHDIAYAVAVRAAEHEFNMRKELAEHLKSL